MKVGRIIIRDKNNVPPAESIPPAEPKEPMGFRHPGQGASRPSSTPSHGGDKGRIGFRTPGESSEASPRQSGERSGKIGFRTPGEKESPARKPEGKRSGRIGFHSDEPPVSPRSSQRQSAPIGFTNWQERVQENSEEKAAAIQR